MPRAGGVVYLSGDNINAVKFPPATAVFHPCPVPRPTVFALQIVVYTAFINVYAVFQWYLSRRR
jgi:hypothetical protein